LLFQKFKFIDPEIVIGIDHKEYSPSTKLSEENIAFLSPYFS